MEGFSELPVRR